MKNKAKNATLNVNDKLYEKFQKYCEEKRFVYVEKLERGYKRWLK